MLDFSLGLEQPQIAAQELQIQPLKTRPREKPG